MIVCHCKGVREASIREAVRSGARSCRQVARACDAGRSCGGCLPVVQAILRDEGASTPCAASLEELAVAAG